MKKYLIIIIITITINKIYCQVSDTNMLETMLDKSLYAVLLSTKCYYENYNNFRKLSDDVIWVNTFPPNFQFSDKIKKTGINFKNSYLLDLDKIQNKIGGFMLSNVRLNNDTIYIYITYATLSCSDKIRNWTINGEGNAFWYKYSCETKKWELLKTYPGDLFIFVE